VRRPNRGGPAADGPSGPTSWSASPSRKAGRSRRPRRAARRTDSTNSRRPEARRVRAAPRPFRPSACGVLRAVMRTRRGMRRKLARVWAQRLPSSKAARRRSSRWRRAGQWW
jgi:hypothetical protein